ncbi:MAG: thermonuclease family protein, partial [Gammaproteobacteria bacterium]|nr:thermonuclease family protein [Gammaproteobacteria bacterium]
MRRINRKNPLTRLLRLLPILLAIGIYSLWNLNSSDPIAEEQWVQVTHVTDGDTIAIGRGNQYQTIRLIGIDTPETVHPDRPVQFYGPEASAFTKYQLDGARIRLGFEPGQHYDRYGRLLAYVYTEDGTLFNALLVQQGYARVIAPQPFRHYQTFKAYERAAKQQRLGIWGKNQQQLST